MRDQPEGRAHPVPQLQFAQVTHVEFRRKGRVIGPRHVIGAKAEPREGLVCGAVEQHGIIAHVEMVVMVDPIRLDIQKGGHERRCRRHLAPCMVLCEPRVKAPQPSSSFCWMISFTALGLALPPVAFITCPTNQPASLGLALAFSTCAGLSAMIWSTAASIAPVSVTCFMPRSSTICAGSPPSV